MKSQLSFGSSSAQLTFFLVLMGQLLMAQISQPNRYEKEQKFNDNDFTVIPLEKQGVALVRETNKYKSGNQTWELILLDTTLKERHTIEFEVDQRKTFIGHEYALGYFYLLFKYGETARITLDLVVINLEDAEVKKYEIKPELALQLTHFTRAEGNFVLGGYVNSESAVLLYNPGQENIKVLPGFFQKETELVELRANKNNTFNAILIDRNYRDNRKIIFKTFDSNGKELLEDIVQLDEKISLQSGIVSELVREDLMIVGAWGGINSRQSAGFYAIPVDPFSNQKIQYVAFGQLSHFFDDLKDSRVKKIQEKTKEDMQVGRVPDFSNYIMPFRIVERADGFLLLAEVFTPSSAFNQFPDDYQSGSYASPYPYYNPYWGYYPPAYNRVYNPVYGTGSNMRNTENVKISKTVLIAFDEKGQVRWDLSTDLDNIRRSSLEQVADISIGDNTVYFLYKKGSELRVKTITLGENEITELTEKIRLLNDTDELRIEREQDGAVRYWYGGNFYVWGYQTIRSRSSQENTNRQVFYINKILVH